MTRFASVLTLGVVLFVGGFALGWYSRGARLVDAGDVVVRVDTIYYERPQFTASSSRTVRVNVPRMLFAPAPEIPDSSGNVSEIPTGSADSVAVALEVETRTYEDSLYRAQVSGPAVGDLGPSLDWIELYARTATQTRTRRQRFALTAGVGAAYTPRGFQPTLGVQVGVVLWGF